MTAEKLLCRFYDCDVDFYLPKDDGMVYAKGVTVAINRCMVLHCVEIEQFDAVCDKSISMKVKLPLEFRGKECEDEPYIVLHHMNVRIYESKYADVAQ